MKKRDFLATTFLFSLFILPFVAADIINVPSDYLTIQEAIDNANPGDVINVSSGTYDENLIIDKSLSLIGSPGNSPGPGSNAPVLDGLGLVGSAIIIDGGVSDVIIQGFEITDYRNSGSSGGIGSGVLAWNSVGTSNIEIIDNYFHDLGWSGVLVGNEGQDLHDNWLVKDNVMEDIAFYSIELTNTKNSEVSGNYITGGIGVVHTPTLTETSDDGILIQSQIHTGSGLTSSSIDIKNNVINGTFERAGIELLAWDSTAIRPAIIEGIDINNNSIKGADKGIYIFSVGNNAEINDVIIEGNVLDENDDGIQIRDVIGGTHGSISIMENKIIKSTGATSGIRIRADTLASNIEVHFNSFINNLLYGVNNEGTGTLNATLNYWGSCDGPGFVGPGRGDNVSINVLFDPWIGNSLIVNPLIPDGDNGWFVTEPEFTLSNNLESGNIFYQWDGGPNFTYSSPFRLEDITNQPNITAGILVLKFWNEFGICNKTRTQTKSLKVDLTNPLITDLVPENNSVIFNNFKPEISALLDEVYQSNSGINLSSITMELNGIVVNANVTSNSDATVKFTPLSDLPLGKNNVTINVTDNAGRFSSLSWFFTINQTPALTMIVHSPESKVYDTTRIPFNITLTGKVKILEYINQNDNRPTFRTLCRNCDGFGFDRTKTKSLKQGENNISIKATDNFGTVNQINISLFIDSKDPRISRTLPRRNSVTNGSGFFIRYEEDNVKELLLSWNPEIDLTSNITSQCTQVGRSQECFFDINLTDFDGQEIEYFFTVEDIANNTDSSRLTKVLVDTTSPIINNPNSFYEVDGRHVSFSINITEENLEEVAYVDNSDSNPRKIRLCSRLKDGICEKRVSFKEGTHNVTVSVIDEVGNNIEIPISFFIDSKDPRISRTLPGRNSVTNGSGFFISYEEDNVKELLLSWNPEIDLTPNITSQCTQVRRRQECFFDINLTDFDGQEIEYRFNITDIVNNTDSSRLTKVLVDTTSPELTVNSPESIIYNSRRIPFNITVSEEVTLEYSDNGARFRRLCSRCDEYGFDRSRTKSFRDGIHEVVIRATDKAGNSDMETINFEIVR